MTVASSLLWGGINDRVSDDVNHNHVVQRSIVPNASSTPQLHSLPTNTTSYDNSASTSSDHDEETIEVSPFVCVVCGGRFPSDERLKQHTCTHINTPHIAYTPPGVSSHPEHSIVAPLSCPSCLKHFASKQSLHRHRLKHTGDSPKYPCIVCHKIYASKQSMQRHINDHHNDKKSSQNVRPDKQDSVLKKAINKFTAKNAMSQRANNITKPSSSPNNKATCEICSKSYASNASLAKHRRVHVNATSKPYQCLYCDISFAHIGELTGHFSVHSSAKPFQCSVCEKGFSQSGHLERHVRVHTGERPFSCSVCGRSYKHKHSLLRHEAEHSCLRHAVVATAVVANDVKRDL